MSSFHLFVFSSEIMLSQDTKPGPTVSAAVTFPFNVDVDSRNINNTDNVSQHRSTEEQAAGYREELNEKT